MKTLVTLILVLCSFASYSQASKDLIGKWQLVKITKNGTEKSIKEQFKSDQVYQVFEEGGKFEGIIAEESINGKWKLSKDDKILTVTVKLIPVKFNLEYIDASKRIIYHKQLGTLEYKKVQE